MSNGSGAGSSGTIIPVVNEEIKPKGLLDAISEIEWYAALESKGSPLPQNFFTIKNKLEFYMVGFKSAFISGILSALFLPVSFGVLAKLIPIFGSYNPTLFDKIFVFIFALSFSLGYAVFVGRVGKFYTGNFAKAMIKNFIGGVVTGALLKIVIVFLLFHFIYIVALKPDNVAYALSYFQRFFTNETLNSIYIWVLEFRRVFLISAWFAVLTTIIFVSYPLITITMTERRSRRAQREIEL